MPNYYETYKDIDYKDTPFKYLMALVSPSDSVETLVYKFILDPPVVNDVPIVQYIGTSITSSRI